MSEYQEGNVTLLIRKGDEPLRLYGHCDIVFSASSFITVEDFEKVKSDLNNYIEYSNANRYRSILVRLLNEIASWNRRREKKLEKECRGFFHKLEERRRAKLMKEMVECPETSEPTSESSASRPD